MTHTKRSRTSRLLKSALCLLLPVALLGQDPAMRGFADIHVHQFANLAFGGYVVSGDAYGRIEDALSEAKCLAGHSYHHNGDTLGGTLAGYGGAQNYNNDGYKKFTGWPAFFEVSHQKVHQDMLRHAVDGGLRLMVMLAEESPLLCQSVVNGGGRSNSSKCADEMTGINSQVDAAHAMQAYIDSQAGGTGKGWYRIVKSPAEARAVIKQGKLAVVLGVETSHLFNCQTDLSCNWEEPLRELWDKDVRHFFPVHHSTNAFGGPSYFRWEIQGPANFYSWLLRVSTYNVPQILCGYAYSHSCDPTGLTPTGKAFIQKLMSLGAIIDVDHMSDHTFKDTLDIATANHYPVVASHSGFNGINKNGQDHEGQLRFDELQRIKQVGGMIGLISNQGDINTVSTYLRPGNKILQVCGQSTETFAQAYYYALDNAKDMRIAIGTDINGPLRQVGPRFGTNQCNGGVGVGKKNNALLPGAFIAHGSNRVVTPFVTGARAWDFNRDGLAHIGLLPDMFADLEVIGVAARDLEPLYTSAEGYVQMWERALRLSSGNLDANTAAEASVASPSIDPGAEGSSDESIPARLYLDGDDATGIFIGSCLAHRITGVSGLTCQLPAPPDDGKSHSVAVYGIDGPNGGARAFQWNSAVPAPESSPNKWTLFFGTEATSQDGVFKPTQGR